MLLKDNHIGAAGGVKEAIRMAKEYAPFVRKIEVEVENLDMVKEAVEAGADIIMLDNMSDEMLKEAIALINGKAEIEVSGNVTAENIERLKKLGVDYISSGALTHSAPIMDISLKKSASDIGECIIWEEENDRSGKTEQIASDVIEKQGTAVWYGAGKPLFCEQAGDCTGYCASARGGK